MSLERALENGINAEAYWARKRNGWDEERACTQPLRQKVKLTDEEYRIAEENGIPRKTVHLRKREGWTTEEAITTPYNHYRRRKLSRVVIYQGGVKQCEGTIQECAKHLGCHPKSITWYCSRACHERSKKYPNSKVGFVLEGDQ